MKNYMNKRFII